MNKTNYDMAGQKRAKPYILTKLLTLFVLAVMQAGILQAAVQSPGVTLNMKDATIDEVIAAIEQQTDYKFLYNKELVGSGRHISVTLQNSTIDQVLKTVLTDNGIDYSLRNKQVILSSKPAETAENITVTGVVSDSNGNPLLGVSVTVKGTSRGAITDAQGRYTVSATTADKLTFFYLGVETQEIAIGNRGVIDVTLQEDSRTMDEVVVIGYGSISKKDLTGAVGIVSGDLIADRGTSQLSTALQGAVPGVTVTRSNSAPGATATVTVRGITTIGDTSPLIIIDGTPAGNINDVNPNDIENISFLKDAASASIYGARAAAGVILITTKRAKENIVNIEYNYEFGLDLPTKRPEYSDAVRYMEMVNELRWNDAGNGADQYPVHPKEEVENYAELHAQNPDKYPMTNWYDLLVKNSSTKHSHRLSITGGTQRVKMKASVSYDDQDGLTENRSYERLMVRMNNDVKVNKFISAQLDVNIRHSHAEAPVTNVFYWARRMPDRYGAFWSDGRISEGRDGSNPYAALMYGGTNQDWYTQYGGRVALFITPLEGLKISGIAAPTYNTTRSKNYTKKIEYFAADNPDELVGTIYDHNKTMLEETRNHSNNITAQILINYDKTFGSHKLSAMAGYEYYYYYNEKLTASRDQYDLDFPYLDAGPVDYRDNSGSAFETGYRSYFGRVVYSFKNRYLLQANVRHDGSSRFASKYRWGTFPSFSAGWVISEEGFMKGVKPISFLKARVSWGQLGNERIGNYPYQAILDIEGISLLYSGDTKKPYTAVAQRKYVERDVTWETTSSLNVGLDASFFNNRLSLSADWYYKMTKDMLLSSYIMKIVGYENPEINTGKMETKGFEVQVGWTDRKGEWNYGVNVHLSDYLSRMGKMGNTRVLGDQVIWNGSYYKEWYGYKSDGLFQTQEEIDNYPTLPGTVKPGDIKYLKKDPNDTSPVNADKDKVLLGNSQPRFEYGGMAFVSFKGIDLSVTVQGVGYQLARMDRVMVEPLRTNWCNMPMILEGKYWSHYNTEEQNRAAEYPRLSDSQRSNNYTLSDFWLFNGAYFRLKNITVGYTLPSKWTKKAFVSKMRVYVSGNDLFCLSNYPKGWDPETGYSNYPITTSFLFGINVNF